MQTSINKQKLKGDELVKWFNLIHRQLIIDIKNYHLKFLPIKKY